MHSLSQDDDSQIKILDGAQKIMQSEIYWFKYSFWLKIQNQIISLKYFLWLHHKLRTGYPWTGYQVPSTCWHELTGYQFRSDQEAFTHIHTELGPNCLDGVVNFLLVTNQSDSKLDKLIQSQSCDLVHGRDPCCCKVVAVPAHL